MLKWKTADQLHIHTHTYIYIYIIIIKGRNWNIKEITMTRKSGTHLHQHTEHWTAVSTLLGLISSAHRDVHHWRSNQQPQYAEA